MQILDLEINHMTPIPGMNTEPAVLSWKTDLPAAKNRITIFHDGTKVFETETADPDAFLGTELLCDLLPCTGYDICLVAERGSETARASLHLFTGKRHSDWQGRWITAAGDPDVPFELERSFRLDAVPKEAVLLYTGLGLSEIFVNGQKASGEALLPGYHAYDRHVFSSGVEITDLLREGDNRIRVLLGDGWYRGRIGYGGGYTNLYGKRNAFLGELWADGKLLLASDESWRARPSGILFSGIYDGEILDPGYLLHEGGIWQSCRLWVPERTGKVMDRLNPPILPGSSLPVQRILRTPKREIVLDFGQEIAGWEMFEVSENTALPRGTALVLTAGEVLQDGSFWNENYRTAKAQFSYVVDGTPGIVRPHFTFFGFRYLKVQLLEDPRAAQEEIPVEIPGGDGEKTRRRTVLVGKDISEKLTDEEILALQFRAVPISSCTRQTGFLSCGDGKVNRLFENILWGQKDNFLDVPTDCPQRDERLGWTGDAQLFSETACFQYDSAAFFRKYLSDLRAEQDRADGSVPCTVPRIPWGPVSNCGLSPWADAACVIPWTLWRAYGSRALLRECFPGMKAFTESVRRKEEKDGGPHLVKSGFHLGDWLALDSDRPGPFGATDPLFIASAYYYEDAKHTAEAATVLGYNEDAAFYRNLSEQILEAVRTKYFDTEGLCTIRTQTACAVSIMMGLNPASGARARQGDLLEKLVHENKGHLNTGFVGTRFLLPALCETGHSNTAVTLFLGEDIPGWLYEVRMGATTVWERWNSMLPNGKANPDGMNSFNHYCFGSVAGWAARYLAGIREITPGYRRVRIAPATDPRLGFFSGKQETPAGTYESSWEIQRNGSIAFTVVIPGSGTAIFSYGTFQNIFGPGRYHFVLTREGRAE